MKQACRDRLFVTGFFLTLLLLLLSACGNQMATPMEAATPSPPTSPVAPESAIAPASVGGGTNVDDITNIIASRTPLPVPTPGLVDQKIGELIEATDLAKKTFLGLTIEDWIDVAISVLIVIIGYIISHKLIAALPKWIARYSSLEVRDDTLRDVGANLVWLLLLFFGRLAVLRLDFLSDEYRTLLDDAFFVLGLVFVTVIALKLVNSAIRHYKNSLDTQIDRDRLAPILLMVRRLGDLIVLIIVGSFGMSHFGVNINVLSAVLVVFALVLSFGAQDMISDMISGFIILVDQPFRVGDAIFIKDLDTWGDVLEIGARTTRIHTGDNREVIVPNKQIVQSQVVNYTHPDPSYRVQTDIGVAYGSDAGKVRQVIEEAVHSVDGVLPDKNVDVLYLEFGDSSRKVRVRWWIGNYHEEQTVLDKVNITLETALTDAGIDLPFNTYDINVNMQKESADA